MDHYSTDMRVGKAAALLNCRRQHVWRLIKAGKLPGSRYTERWGHVVPRRTLEEYRRASMERHRNAAEQRRVGTTSR